MTAVLLLVTCFQFLCACIGIQQSPLYFALNPYVTLAPLFLVWLASLGFYRQPIDKNFVLVGLLVIGIQIMVSGAFGRSDGFPFNFVRSIQFFWGPVFLTPMLLGLFRLSGAPADPRKTAQDYIKALCIVAAGITFLEVVLIWFLHVPPTALPWIPFAYLGFHRPFGLAAYPQPNAVILALLFWLSFLYEVPGRWHRFLAFCALCLTLGATGVMAFIALLPLWTRRPFLYSVLATVPVIGAVSFATLTSQWASQGLLWKFDLVYWDVMREMFSRVFTKMLSRFSESDILMGASSISPQAATGLTHDWAYFDIFYVSGLIGLTGYIILYAVMTYLACPREVPVAMRLYFVIIALAANFHYGTLNYFIGQALFSCLAALNIYRNYRVTRTRENRAPQIVQTI
jgi:hypothetical protein